MRGTPMTMKRLAATRPKGTELKDASRASTASTRIRTAALATIGNIAISISA